jgi:hypothetical protein
MKSEPLYITVPTSKKNRNQQASEPDIKQYE